MICENYTICRKNLNYPKQLIWIEKKGYKKKTKILTALEIEKVSLQLKIY